VSKQIETIVDSAGKVWTGAVTNYNDHAGEDFLTALATLGISELAGRSTPTYTVEVNGQTHSGHRAK